MTIFFMNAGVILFFGIYITLCTSNLVKKMIGLALFQNSILMFFIASARSWHETDPVPHVLMLTAIVVGLASFAVSMSIIKRIQESFGSIDEEKIDV